MTVSIPLKRSSVLFKCLMASLVFHVITLLVFYRYPSLFTSTLSAVFPKAPPPNPIFIAKEAPVEKNAILKEVFEAFSIPPSTTHSLVDLDNNFYPFQDQPIKDDPIDFSFLFTSSLPSIFVPNTPSRPDIAVYDPTLLPQDHAVLGLLEKKGSIDPAQDLHMPVSLIEESALTKEVLSELPHESLLPRQEMVGIVKQSTVVLPPLHVDVPASKTETLEKAWVSQQPLPTSPKQIVLPTSPSLTKEDLAVFTLPAAQVLDQNFDVEIDVMPLSQDPGEEKGFFFSLKLTPHFDMDLERSPQVFTFIIDTSTSIEKHRFNAFKKGVAKALSCLKEGDLFEICLINQQLTRFHQHPLAVSKQTVQKAEEFLEKQEQNQSVPLNVYGSLEKIFSTSLSDEQFHTAILLTDGKSLMPTKKQQQDIRSWMLTNQGKVCLHTATAGTGNNLPLLTLVSRLNNGELLYSDTHAAFPRKLGKLMLDLREPLANGLVMQAIPADSAAQVTLHTPLSAPLYNNKSYTIQGTISKVSDFTLLIQGRHHNQWLTMEQSIAFGKVKQESKALEKQIALQDACTVFQKFVQNGATADLERVTEAVKKLSPK